MGKLIFAQPQKKDLDWTNIIRWDEVNADLAKGKDSEIIKILNGEAK